MIEIQDINASEPYKRFIEFYNKAVKYKQPFVESIVISSFNKLTKQVESRFVNLKYVLNNEWIFFTNYNSNKSQDFKEHNQISVLLFWHSINVQIRIKANIKKTNTNFNQMHFSKRSIEKNALAISSRQSSKIDSYASVIKNYDKSLKNKDLKKCPDYWGGYSFTPYYFEFWEGHESRLNKREVFNKVDDEWKHSFLQP
ncbi:pyridoxamine 5'-phosphate oxidase family protein [Gammaproteobacteria bacterium]|nr:pyridoxamine 5'-phosphate oxidase family protein [Gammaproteobacteria bacterium]MDA9575296.1 pyridoxamine 5'-phosphate oxidase family protein [Gammaproteobacteria bacterium]MDC3411148.1 pyridoxamine 5'-phosphate oxidase family protein [Gammaproteobacteria bacterium]